MIGGPWWKLWVKAPEGNGLGTPEGMKRVDDALTLRVAAYFESPNGLPEQEPDGTFVVRVMETDFLPLTKRILQTTYGLEVIREEIQEDKPH
jgi:hypothetical protein